MNAALVIPLAATWGWGIGMAACVLVMGVVMFAMMRHGRTQDSPRRSWPGRWPGARSETPADVLERRFTKGEMSVEEYRKRREILALETVTQDEDEAPTTPSSRERRQ